MCVTGRTATPHHCEAQYIALDSTFVGPWFEGYSKAAFAPVSAPWRDPPKSIRPFHAFRSIDVVLQQR